MNLPFIDTDVIIRFLTGDDLKKKELPGRSPKSFAFDEGLLN